MKIITVIPITKGIFRQKLSYFTSKNVSPGMLVTIPVHKKIVPALVLSSQEIKKIKSNLKRADFSLKSIKDIGAKNFLRPEFLEACKEIADYFVSPVGAIIKDFIPQAVLSLMPDLEYSESDIEARNHYETVICQQPEKERVQFYRSVAREEFAKNRSVFICAPTIADIEELSDEIKKGIEKHTIALHGGLTGKKIRELWHYALAEKHPVLIIATRSFLGLPRNDIGSLIIEREGSSFYKLLTRPYLDVRKAAEIIATRLKIRLILGDDIVRSEAFYRNRLITSQRILTGAEQILTDMKKIQLFQTIGPELEKILKESIKKNGHSVLFVSRKGYAPLTICQDCLRPILCAKCNAPAVVHKDPPLHSAKEGPLRPPKIKLVCHKCLTEIIVPEKCPYCQSWRLQSFGAGIQKLQEEIAGKINGVKLFRLDSDAVKTKRAGRQIAEKFLNTPGGILIGTEMIFSYIRHLTDKPVENSAAVFLDSLFALPDFRINEKIFQILLRLRGMAKKTFLIQTRLAEMEIFDYAFKGNVSGFYRMELERKKQFGYPPFKTIIKVTGEEKNQEVLKKEIKQIEQRLAKWDPMSYPAFIGKIKGVHIWHIIMKLEPDTWPEQQKELREILSSLPPSWKINVDPESLL